MHGVVTASAQRMNALLSVYSSIMQKPFEIETIARQELQRDRLFPRLTPEQREFYVTAALAIGAREAAHYRGESMLSLARKLGARVEDYDGGNVVAGCEIYAEYDAVFRSIRLHRAGVAHLAARLGQTLPEAIAQETARDLLIAHELFHHLEATCLGPVHRTLPSISVSLVGRLWRVQRHILRTREIAAHSFAHTLLGMTERLDRG
jgi:hypothetical protein